MAPQIAALKAHAVRFYKGDDTWMVQPPFTVTPTTASITYASNGLPADHTDKVYAHDTTITLGNYSQALEAGTAASGAATTIVLAGLSPGRVYHIACIRFNLAGTPVEISNEEVIRTPRTSLEVIPPNLSKQVDWSQDKFNDWLTVSSFPWDNAGPFYSLQQASDVEMGPYIHAVYSDLFYALNANEETVPIIFNLGCFEGVKGLSPRHDWRIDIPLRVEAPNNLLQNYYNPEQGATLCQMETGVASGDQCEILVAHNQTHNLGPGQFPADSIGGFVDLTGTIGNDAVTGLWGTRYPNTDYGTPHPIARTAWSVVPRTTHPLYTERLMPFGQRVVFSFRYTAANKELRVYMNAVLHSVMGATHQLPTYRKKFPDGHYDFAIVPKIKFQNLGNYNESPADQFIDIGGLFVESACPMHYAGWSARQGGSQASQAGHMDPYNLQDLYDPTQHSLHGLTFLSNNSFNPARYGTTLHSGYTVPATLSTPYGGDPFYLSLEELEPQVYNNNTPPTFSTALHTARTLPVNIPQGTRAAYVVFHGYQQHGTLRARLVDQAGTPIMDWVTVDRVTNAPVLEVPDNSATAVQAEVEIQYDGTPIDWSTQCSDGNLPATMEEWRPATPSLFVGFEVYSADPNNIPTLDPPTIYTVDAPTANLALQANAPAVHRILLVQAVSADLSLSAGSPGVYRVLQIQSPTADLALQAGIPQVSTTSTGYNPIRAPSSETIAVYCWDGTQHRPVTIIQN